MLVVPTMSYLAVELLVATVIGIVEVVVTEEEEFVMMKKNG